MLPAKVKALNHRAIMIAKHSSSKKRAVVLRLPASQQVSRELGRLHGTGLQISLSGPSTALVVFERDTVCSAVQKFRLACRSVLLHECPASLSGDGSGGETRVERKS